MHLRRASPEVGNIEMLLGFGALVTYRKQLILYYIILYYIILYYIILSYLILYYIILSCIILYYIILYYIASGPRRVPRECSASLEPFRSLCQKHQRKMEPLM